MSNVVVPHQKAHGGSNKPTFVTIAVILYLISVPLIASLSVGADISQALGIFAASMFVIRVLLTGDRIRLPLELILFGIFIAYTFVGGFIAVNMSVFMSTQFTLIQLWVLSVVLFNVFTLKQSDHYVLLRAIQVSVVATAVVSAPGFLMQSGRMAGTLLNANSYGLAMLLGFAATLIFPVRGRLARVAQLIVIVFLSSQAMLSGSRKAMLGVLTFVGLYGLLTVARNSRRPGAVFALIFVFALASLGILRWAQSSPYWYRVETFVSFMGGEEVAEGSISVRAQMIASGLELWREHPIIGVGTNQFRYYAHIFGISETYSHSNPVELLANFGIIGALLYYSIYAAITWRIMSAWRGQRHVPEKRHQLATGACFFLVWALLELAWVSYYSKIHWIAFGLVLVITYNIDGPNVSVVDEEYLARNEALALSRGGRF